MFKNIFILKSDKTSIHLVRAIFASNLAFAVDFGLLALLTEVFSIHYLFSNIISFITGTTLCYILNTLWVFSERRFKRRHFEYLIFIILGVIGVGLNELLIWFFTENIHIHYLISKIIAGSAVFFFNFFTRKYVLFHKKMKPS